MKGDGEDLVSKLQAVMELPDVQEKVGYYTASKLQNPNFAYTKENLTKSWGILSGFTILYALIGLIFLERIDKDKRYQKSSVSLFQSNQPFLVDCSEDQPQGFFHGRVVACLFTVTVGVNPLIPCTLSIWTPFRASATLSKAVAHAAIPFIVHP